MLAGCRGSRGSGDKRRPRRTRSISVRRWRKFFLVRATPPLSRLWTPYPFRRRVAVPLYVHDERELLELDIVDRLLEVKFQKGQQEGPHGHGATPGLRKRYR
jgi:hypothetical protein